ncbi:MAG: hypothetical protein M1128_00120 [Candidatus Marsarchaeota archaeon]|nr:hypothetical protein [Candidatus Marsarchaeota archaeon]
MEAKKDNDENFALLEKLAGNDYEAFLALSMLSNHKDGTKCLDIVKTMGLDSNGINFIFKNVVNSDIEKMAMTLSALGHLGSNNIKKIADLSCNVDGKLDIMAFIIVTGSAMAKYIENPVSETQAVTYVVNKVEIRGLKGRSIYDDYCSFINAFMRAEMGNNNAETFFVNSVVQDKYISHTFVDEVVVDYMKELEKREQLTDYIR